MNIIDEILLGIDFGTTNTVISQFKNNKAITLSDGVFKTIPSKIAKSNGKLHCGNYIPVNSQNQIHSFKTSIGENKIFNFNEPDINYTHKDLLIVFFSHLYELVIKNLKLSGTNFILKTVITVPSNFNDAQREIIKNCFISVGFKVIRIINEPSAAALAYGLSHSLGQDETILVIDTGGGTMDFTILQKYELFFEVVHSEGLNDLGGNNFTRLILNDILRTCNIMSSENINHNVLWNQSQKIKEKLTYLDIYETKLNGIIDGHCYDYLLTKSKFENLSNHLIQKIQDTLSNIIREYSNINYIILVGGTSRIPILQNIISKTYGKKPWIHPSLESVVAEGAGLFAGIIENKFISHDDVVLMDVLPLSLGVELADGSYSIIIPKNTPLPIKRSQKYTTDLPGESSIKIKIYQGERIIANKNFLIGEFVFDKVTAGGVPVIEISFKVDLNSIINVSISDKKSGVEKNILIKDIAQIDSDEIENIIAQANSLHDTDESELLRTQNIYVIKTFIENTLINISSNDKIEESEKNKILNKVRLIEDSMDTMTNIQLVETIVYLQENYTLIGSTLNRSEDLDDKMNGIEKMFLSENKNNLINRIQILLIKNPDWEEFLNPVLSELSYNNVTIDYVNDKLKLLDEIENNDNEQKDYKQEVNNLCLFLKNEIESGSIDLGTDKNILLVNLINVYLDKISKSINDHDDWENTLMTLNRKCEEIYNTDF